MGNKKPAQQPLPSSANQLDSSVTDESVDKRHLKRIKLMQYLFAYTFDAALEDSDDLNLADDRLPEDEDLRKQVKNIAQDLDEIDRLLQKYAPERPLADINLVDLAVLRLIVWESRHKKTPKKVLIDEAVELAKEYGSDSSPRFVNGVLGKLLIENGQD